MININIKSELINKVTSFYNYIKDQIEVESNKYIESEKENITDIEKNIIVRQALGLKNAIYQRLQNKIQQINLFDTNQTEIKTNSFIEMISRKDMLFVQPTYLHEDIRKKYPFGHLFSINTRVDIENIDEFDENSINVIRYVNNSNLIYSILIIFNNFSCYITNDNTVKINYNSVN